LLDKLGYDEVPIEDDLKRSLRLEAAKWACSLDDPTCIESARYKLIRHLANPEKNM